MPSLQLLLLLLVQIEFSIEKLQFKLSTFFCRGCPRNRDTPATSQPCQLFPRHFQTFRFMTFTTVHLHTTLWQRLQCWRQIRADSIMSFLRFARDDRVLILGLAAAAVGIFATIRISLIKMRDEAEIKQKQPTTQYITQETEDSLKPNTLDTLLFHYNYAIRDIAGKIVTDRAVNDSESINYLLWGITRPDYDERLKCLRTLAYITDPRRNSRCQT